MSKYNLKIENRDGVVAVTPSIFQRLRGVNRLAHQENPVTLTVEIPESIAQDFAFKVFGIVTNGRPVVIRIATPRVTQGLTGVLV